MKRITVKEVARACGGRLLLGDEEAEISHICIDSREAGRGSLFVPFVGENVDAHRFLSDVRRRGAAAALTSEGFAGLTTKEGAEPFALIAVEDSLEALQRLAASRRNRIPFPLVGVTGSVGKTTTREMIATALSAGKRVYRTPANHNGQIGVPLTLLGVEDDYDIGVIEMGMSMPGEMTKISALVRPDTAVLTNIGYAHIQQLKTQEAILAEKLHIQDGMAEHAVVFLNGEDPLLRSCRLRDGLHPVFYGMGEDCQVQVKDVTMENGCAHFTAVAGGQKTRVRLRVFGAHQVLNAAAALAVAAHYGVDLDGAAEALSGFQGFRHRQQIFFVNGVTWIDDSYNASPSSMQAALAILGSIQNAARRIAVLADMKELGEQAEALHEEMGRTLAAGREADMVFTLGELGALIGTAAKKENPAILVRNVSSLSELESALRDTIQAGDAVLLKGSNSMGLSQLADHMTGGCKAE
ncbi:hypothetical protein B6K86_01175 [Lachnospiraceae bacterium]|nr:hypothetical protein B6K86_01175 [Lachnospiraceae bacterium]